MGIRLADIDSSFPVSGVLYLYMYACKCIEIFIFRRERSCRGDTDAIKYSN